MQGSIVAGAGGAPQIYKIVSHQYQDARLLSSSPACVYIGTRYFAEGYSICVCVYIEEERFYYRLAKKKMFSFRAIFFSRFIDLSGVEVSITVKSAR